MEDVSIVTAANLLSAAGAVCKKYHDDNVRGITGRREVQCNELWSFVYAKDKNAPYVESWNGAGNAWTFMALDADSKLLIAYRVALGRSTRDATQFMKDLVDRLEKEPRLTADNLKAYWNAAQIVFGRRAKIVLSQVRKGEETDHNTAYVERHKLSIRMGNRRFTRKTNAFSKKFAKHKDMMHLWMLHYNFCHIHGTLRITPAMEADLTSTIKDCSGSSS